MSSEIEKDYYRLYLIMFSNDWSEMTPIIDRVLKSPEAVQLFTYQPYNLGALLTSLGYGKQMSNICQRLLKNDPFNNVAQGERIEAMMFAGSYDKAIESIDSINSYQRDGRLNYNKLFSMYQLGKFDEAYNLLKQLDSSNIRNYNSMLAMLLAKKGKVKEAKQIMDKDVRVDYALFGIKAAYGREAANKEASTLDKKLVMHHILLFNYLHSTKNPPFDLSATPNFVKRFKQAGVNISQKK
jgi:tetratricopeptide (TPR) repeat protein